MTEKYNVSQQVVKVWELLGAGLYQSRKPLTRMAQIFEWRE
jgi:hypothetical protein